MEQMYLKIVNMSNKEAAVILKNYINAFTIPRGSAKTIGPLMFLMAVNKAIKALENTPDSKEK